MLFKMILQNKKVILGTKFKRCVQHHELRATECYFLGGFVRSNLSKPCAIPSITFLDVGLASTFERVNISVRERLENSVNASYLSSKMPMCQYSREVAGIFV